MPEFQDRVFRLAYSILKDRGGGRGCGAGDIRAGLEGPARVRRPRGARHLDLRHRAQYLPDGTAQAPPDGLARRSGLDRSPERRDEIATATAPADDPERDNLLRLVETLPANQQQAVRLFYLEDRSYDAVAEALGMPLGTVKNLLFRARKRLMELARPEEVMAA